MMIMERDEAREYIKTHERIEPYLHKAKHGGLICPFCGSGSGNNGKNTGAVKIYKTTNTISCFAGCVQGSEKGHKYDVIDVFRQQTGIDYLAALEQLAEKHGITLVPNGSFNAHGDQTPQEASQPAEQPSGDSLIVELDEVPQEAPQQAERAADDSLPRADYRDYYARCEEQLKSDQDAQAYLKSRGISLGTAVKGHIGFDPASDIANCPGDLGEGTRLYPCPRIITPCMTDFYVGRSIDPNTPAQYKKMNPSREKGAGAPNVYGLWVLNNIENNDIIIVAEGAFDALSVMEFGYKAIALNSANNSDKLLGHVKNYADELKQKNACLILCPDNDDRGRACMTDIADKLQAAGLSYKEADICCGAKDPNEALVKDRGAFESVLRGVVAGILRPDNILSYIDGPGMAKDLEDFRGCVKTGFVDLDQKCGGGLYAGLYVVGAVSSLGKTTFCHQMADQIAAAGTDVLFFSLEQTRLEMVSKSLSRITAQWDIKNYVSSISIRRGNVSRLVLEAADEYKTRAGSRMNIIQGDLKTDVTTVVNYVKQYIERTGERPVVFVDYLQVLKPDRSDARKKDKREEIDDTVGALQNLSRTCGVPVIVISSINRTNYLTPIDYESFKESGTIEYTADVVWGLQLDCIDNDLFGKQGNIKEKRDTVNNAMAKTPREVQLVSLKNRYGSRYFKCEFDYYPACDLFQEAEQWEVIKHGDDILLEL